MPTPNGEARRAVYEKARSALVNQLITQQAYQLSFNELFYALGWVFLLLIPLIWLTKPPFTPKIGGAPGGGH